ncbi:MAG: hypothetical protein ACRDZ8_10955 [Acidimicrobiales bacterium]
MRPSHAKLRRIDRGALSPWWEVRQGNRLFCSGFTETFRNLAEGADVDVPMLVVYAHRQEDSEDGGGASTAWDAMLSPILAANLTIVGTWPLWAANSTKQIGQGANALASYVVMVCRPQVAAARPTDRQGFMGALRAELPKTIRNLQEGAISTIDLGEATIGPGMAIFSRFARVIEPSGQAMSVHSALELITQVQSEVLDEFVGDLDPETRWPMLWSATVVSVLGLLTTPKRSAGRSLHRWRASSGREWLGHGRAR